MVNPALRNYRIPAFADVPPSEVFFADTYDTIGPLGAKSQGECAINPVAPAIANALADATGVRFAHLPLTPDRIFDKLGAGHEREDPSAASGRPRSPSSPRRGSSPRAPRRSPAGRRTISAAVAGVSRLHRPDGDAAEPAGAGRLGDPAALRQHAARRRLAEFRRAARALRRAQPMLVGQRRCPHRQGRRLRRAAGAGVGGDLHAHQAGPGGCLSRAGSSGSPPPRRGRRASRATASSRRSPACRTTGWRSCVSIPRPTCRPG